MEELTAIHFLAQMINAKTSLENGYSHPTRWLTLREDLQKECLQQAKKMVNDWISEEIEAKKSRESFKSNITIKEY